MNDIPDKTKNVFTVLIRVVQLIHFQDNIRDITDSLIDHCEDRKLDENSNVQVSDGKVVGIVNDLFGAGWLELFLSFYFSHVSKQLCIPPIYIAWGRSAVGRMRLEEISSGSDFWRSSVVRLLEISGGNSRFACLKRLLEVLCVLATGDLWCLRDQWSPMAGVVLLLEIFGGWDLG